MTKPTGITPEEIAAKISAKISKFKPEYVPIAHRMAQMGMVDEEMAEVFGVSIRTLYRWSAAYPEFRQALVCGKEAPDDRVAAALFHRAVGYTHDDLDIRVVENKLVKTEIKKHYPPDVKAALAWLYNRRREEWHPFPKTADEDANSIVDALKALIESRPN